ncbi:MAG: hypothetical protein K2K80_06310 [Clostridia bacterium]|nr:hypothetical protein [Clostridia bacterium]
MSKTVKRLFASALGVLSALFISTSVCAFTSLFNSGLQASAQETEVLSPAADEGTQALVWSCAGGEIESNSTKREYDPRVDYIENQSVKAFIGDIEEGNQIPAENITVTKGSETVTEVKDIGVYTFTVGNDDNLYTNTVFTLEIIVKEVDLCNGLNMQWEIASGSGASLADGDVYCYLYYEKTNGPAKYYYSTNEVALAPNASWIGWQPVKDESKSVIHSLVGYIAKSSGCRIRLTRDQDYGEGYYYNATYSSVCEAKESGKYVARAVVGPASENYKLLTNRTDEAMKSLNGRGVTIDRNDDGTYTITKTWYIAHFTNEFLDVSSKYVGTEKAVSYKMSSWTFGAFSADEVNMPLLRHGDELRANMTPYGNTEGRIIEQREGYELKIDGEIIFFLTNGNNGGLDWNKVECESDWRDGVKDIVTFTLYRGNQLICENQPRRNWEQYINQYTPVGSYRVVFTAVSVNVSYHYNWWNGGPEGIERNSVDYEGISNAYTFEVFPGKLQIENSSTAAREIEFNSLGGDFSEFFDIQPTFPNLIDKKTVAALSNTKYAYWADRADEFYDEAPVLSFHLIRMEDKNAYYTADSEEWNDIINIPDKYVVYYKATMKNYASSDDGKYTVYLYQEVEEPVLSRTSFTYNGLEQTANIKGNASIFKISDNSQTDVGTYYAKIEFVNPSAYRWKNKEEDITAPVILKYEIKPASMPKPVITPREYTGKAQKPDLTIITDNDGNALYEVVDTEAFASGYTAVGTHHIKLKLTDTKNYVWTENGKPVPNVTDGIITVDFVITVMQNKWVTNVGIDDWDWSDYSRRSNLFSASCLSGTPVEYYVTTDAEGENKVSKLGSFTATKGMVTEEIAAELNKLSCGTYYLWGKVDETENYSALAAEPYEFKVNKATNGWLTAPSITQWAYGTTPQNPKATAKHGEVLFEIVLKNDGEVYYSTKNNVNRLALCEAGEYQLTVWVEGTANYDGIEKVEKDFRVFPKSSDKWVIAPYIANWTEGDEAPNPVGEAVAEGAEIVYNYRTSDGTDLGNRKPTTAGDYVLIAVAYVDGNEVVRAECNFKIFLRTNEWVVEPSIDNWAQGGKASTPHGEAKAGEITYSYKTSKGELLLEKPTQAGSYLLVATVEAEGYQKLVKEVAFSITEPSGMGTEILIIIAVLAVLVIALAVAMIVLFVKPKGKKQHAPKQSNAKHGRQLEIPNLPRPEHGHQHHDPEQEQ